MFNRFSELLHTELLGDHATNLNHGKIIDLSIDLELLNRFILTGGKSLETSTDPEHSREATSHR